MNRFPASVPAVPGYMQTGSVWPGTGVAASCRTIASRLSVWTVCLLLLTGMYFPTSIEGEITTVLSIVAGSILGVGLLLLIVTCGVAGPPQFAIACAVFIIICAATLFSPFTQKAYGALVPLSLLTVLLCVDLRSVPAVSLIGRVFTLVNLINLTGAALLMANLPDVNQFLIQNYSAFYPELVRAMLGAGKPVLTFATHSLAGFAFYIYFYLCLRTHIETGRVLDYLFALSYLLILMLIGSFSSYAFALLAVGQLVLRLRWRRPLMIVVPLVLFIGLAIAWAMPDTSILDEQYAAIMDVLSLDANGIRGRYVGRGELTSSIRFITEFPFSPVGAGYSSDLMYGDSGPVEYMLRGSVPLVLAIYGGLWLFFRRNLRSRAQGWFLFGVFLLFELGFSNLLYFRTQYLMPFVVVYLNSLEVSRTMKNART